MAKAYPDAYNYESFSHTQDVSATKRSKISLKGKVSAPYKDQAVESSVE